eukprot:5489752-Prymnesium_polylepis.1
MPHTVSSNSRASMGLCNTPLMSSISRNALGRGSSGTNASTKSRSVGSRRLSPGASAFEFASDCSSNCAACRHASHFWRAGWKYASTSAIDGDNCGAGGHSTAA